MQINKLFTTFDEFFPMKPRSQGALPKFCDTDSLCNKIWSLLSNSQFQTLLRKNPSSLTSSTWIGAEDIRHTSNPCCMFGWTTNRNWLVDTLKVARWDSVNWYWFCLFICLVICFFNLVPPFNLFKSIAPTISLFHTSGIIANSVYLYCKLTLEQNLNKKKGWVFHVLQIFFPLFRNCGLNASTPFLLPTTS